MRIVDSTSLIGLKGYPVADKICTALWFPNVPTAMQIAEMVRDLLIPGRKANPKMTGFAALVPSGSQSVFADGLWYHLPNGSRSRVFLRRRGAPS